MKKQHEIVTKILEIPLEKWNDCETELNGLKIVLNPMYGGHGKFFAVKGIDFYDDRIEAFYWKLENTLREKREKSKLDKIEEIYKLLCN